MVFFDDLHVAQKYQLGTISTPTGDIAYRASVSTAALSSGDGSVQVSSSGCV